eukprot:COSAG02_NODE_1180_length_14037_cov_73.962907_5_plen_55_part_00
MRWCWGEDALDSTVDELFSFNHCPAQIEKTVPFCSAHRMAAGTAPRQSVVYTDK